MRDSKSPQMYKARVARAMVLVLLVGWGLAAAGCSGQNAGQDGLRAAQKLMAQGKISNARTQIDQALAEQSPTYSSYLTAMHLYAANDCHADAARVGDAVVDLAEAEKLDRKLSREELAGLYVTVAQMHQETGNLAGAEHLYEAALALAPDSAELLNCLGYFYADEGIKPDLAVRLTTRAVQLAPTAGHIIDSLGWAQHRAGDYEAAAQSLRKAVELMPGDPTLRYHLGAVYAQQGKTLQARIELKKSLSVDPQMTDAANLLTTLQPESH